MLKSLFNILTLCIRNPFFYCCEAAGLVLFFCCYAVLVPVNPDGSVAPGNAVRALFASGFILTLAAAAMIMRRLDMENSYGGKTPPPIPHTLKKLFFKLPELLIFSALCSVFSIFCGKLGSMEIPEIYYNSIRLYLLRQIAVLAILLTTAVYLEFFFIGLIRFRTLKQYFSGAARCFAKAWRQMLCFYLLLLAILALFLAALLIAGECAMLRGPGGGGPLATPVLNCIYYGAAALSCVIPVLFIALLLPGAVLYPVELSLKIMPEKN